MEQTPIGKLLWKLSPPVMLALLIQSIYNIVDSCFIARYSSEGLTALSIVYPIQLLMTAVSTGTGAGLNILLSRMDGRGENKGQSQAISSGLFLGVINYLFFVIVGIAFLRPFFAMSSNQAVVCDIGVVYGQIVLFGSIGLFMEAMCTKIFQARGSMVLPMVAQIVGAVINILLDPLLIFGIGIFPEMGIRGAAIATVIGQFVSMCIVLGVLLKKEVPLGLPSMKQCGQIYQKGVSSVVMQSLYTLYIVGLNLILKGFTEDAVTVLGIYYKLQTFFFIPLMGLQQVAVPVISFNYGAGNLKRVRQTLNYSTVVSVGFMGIGCIMFWLFPARLIGIFSDRSSVIGIGCYALRVIAISFVPAAIVLMRAVFFQGIDQVRNSIFITILRQVFLLVPLAWLLHFAGLNAVWFTFPITEVIVLLYCRHINKKQPIG